MKQNKNNSILLSQVCVILFALLLAALDVTGWWWTRWFAALRGMAPMKAVWMMISLYTCSIPAWITLLELWRLLRNIMENRVFVDSNVRLMHVISLCCVAAAVICLFSSAYYLAFLVLALSSAFMALIVRIVRDAFRRAIEMQSELDLTI